MSWLARSIANTLRLDDDDEEEEDDFTHSYRNDVVSRAAAGATSSSVTHAVDEEEDSSNYEDIDLLEDRSNYNNSDSNNPNYDDGNHTYNRNPGGGVKEDLSEFTETLTRQLWGVASFLAPPPSKSDQIRSDPGQPGLVFGNGGDYSEDSDYQEEDGVEEDCVGDAPPPPLLPQRKSDLFGSDPGQPGLIVEDLDYQDDDDEVEKGSAVGVTEEVLAFATNIAHHPETWLDFPLCDDDEEDFDDFELSEAQHKHSYAVERLTPRLAALRIELCPAHVTEGYFWMVYFVLLYSRLNKHDAEVLSTPQLVEARAMWMQELQKKTKPESDRFGMDTFHARQSTYSPRGDFESSSSEDAHSRYVLHQRAFTFEPPTCHSTSDTETEKHSIETTEIQFIDKAVVEEDLPSKIIEKEVTMSKSFKLPVFDYDEHEDDWLNDNLELEGYSSTAILNEDDVSFSDLEDDIDCAVPRKPKAESINYNPALNTS